MGYNRGLKDVEDSQTTVTKAQLATLAIILCLSVDSINPIKVILHVFPQIHPWHVATLCISVMLYIVVTELKPLLYFSVKVFFHSILSIFFRDVEVIGLENIPRYGPVIFTGNHANQFIDGVTILCTCQRTISYLVAEKSWNRPVIGHLSWALGAVPVKRAQDSSRKGKGSIVNIEEQHDESPQQGEESQGGDGVIIKKILIEGKETTFATDVKVGDKIRFQSHPTPYKVVHVKDDTRLVVEVSGSADDLDIEPLLSCPLPSSFDVLERVDQSKVYTAVLDKLSGGGCIGIFPEGGSHDRTDLLPLKVGVSLIAYQALLRDGTNIPIVPVGLNYFHAHRFRGRAIVEFGAPIHIDPSTSVSFQEGGAAKRKVCNELLERIEDSMRSVLVTVPDYATLRIINTARRLYQRNEVTASQKQDLNRRFAEGYKRLLLLLETKGGTAPKEWTDIRDRIEWYQTETSELGLRDYQVMALRKLSSPYTANSDTALREMRLPYRILSLLFVMALALLPALLLNFPVGLVAGMYAEMRRKKALAGSKVKIRGLDVILSEKVVLCIVLVPTLWMVYGLIFYSMNMDGPTLTLSILSMPLFSYVGIVMTEAGMIHLKDLRPYAMRLLPSTNKRLVRLPGIRKQLQDDLRQFIKQVGPTLLGDLYYQKQVDWKEIQEASRKRASTNNLLSINSKGVATIETVGPEDDEPQYSSSATDSHDKKDR